MTGVNGQVVLDHFNPRPREEGDFHKGTFTRDLEIFQSTPS